MTRVLASFHTDEDPRAGDIPLCESDPRLGHIVGVSISKTLGEASGSWSLTIKKPPAMGARSWLRQWNDPEGVWVNIKFDIDARRIHTMFGIVDSVNESTTRAGEGARNETYTISGRDFGKVFETNDCFTNIYADPNGVVPQMLEVVNLHQEEMIGAPDHWIRLLCELWLSNNGLVNAPWIMPASLLGGRFYDLLGLTGLDRGTIQRMTRSLNGECLDPQYFSTQTTQGQKLWDSMTEMSHGLLNELFVDLARSPENDPDNLDELYPSIFLRERPFPTRNADNRSNNLAAWESLRTHDLELHDVTTRTIAKGGAAHRFNYWILRFNNEEFAENVSVRQSIGTSGSPGNMPTFNQQSIQRHGIRRWEQSTRWLPISSATEADTPVWGALARTWLKKLHDWYAPAPFEYSGTIRTPRVFPEIRIGERVREHRHEGTIVYYVEGVTHEWSYPGAGSTTLTLTRGEYEGEDTLEHIYHSYDAPAVVPAENACITVDENDTAANIDALAGALASGQRLCVPPVPTGAVHHGDTVGITDADGNVRFEAEDPLISESENPAAAPDAIDQPPPLQEPSIADGALPTPQEVLATPPLTEESLRSGQPLPTTSDALDFGDDDDPIGGI